MSKTMPIRVDAELFEAARVAGAIASRSGAQQMAHWAKIGRALEAAPHVSTAEIHRLLREDPETINAGRATDGEMNGRSAPIKDSELPDPHRAAPSAQVTEESSGQDGHSDVERRRELAIDTMASWALSGMYPDEETITFINAVIEGRMTTEELIAQVKNSAR